MDAKGSQALKEYINRRQARLRTMSGYVDTGDRIVVKDVEPAHNGFGSTSLKPEHLGMHGKVLNNDGWGHCRIRLDNGDEADCWNGAHLELENGD